MQNNNVKWQSSGFGIERWHYAIKLEQVLRPIGVPEGKIDFFLGVVLGVGLVIA